MAAGGLDVGAEVLSHGVMDVVFSQDCLEFLNGGVSWLLVRGQAGAGIIADEVDVQ